MELDVEVIRDLGYAYLPHVYDEMIVSPAMVILATFKKLRNKSQQWLSS